MTTIAKTTLLALVLLAGSMQLTQAATPYTTDLSTLPAKVAQAARAAQPGIVLKKHRLLWTSDEGEYLIVGGTRRLFRESDPGGRPIYFHDFCMQ